MNDLSKRVFEVSDFVRKNDLLIIFSSSGDSADLVLATTAALYRKAEIIAIVGQGGGRLREGLSDLAHGIFFGQAVCGLKDDPIGYSSGLADAGNSAAVVCQAIFLAFQAGILGNYPLPNG